MMLDLQQGQTAQLQCAKKWLVCLSLSTQAALHCLDEACMYACAELGIACKFHVDKLHVTVLQQVCCNCFDTKWEQTVSIPPACWETFCPMLAQQERLQTCFWTGCPTQAHCYLASCAVGMCVHL